MLYRLEVENFASIRERQIIDLRVGAGVDDDGGRFAPIWAGAKERAPKVVALFGANASGKSNALKAISFVAWFVTKSFSASRGNPMPYDRFNRHDTFKSPTRLAIHFGGTESIECIDDPDAKQCAYFYEFVLDGENKDSVISESLYYRPSGSARKLKLFERSRNGTVTAARAFDLADYQPALKKILRHDASVVATLAQLDHPFSVALWNAAQSINTNILVERVDNSERDVIRFYADRSDLVDALNREIERIDLGIQNFEIRFAADGPVALFHHQGLSVPMPLFYESHGTRQFIKIFPLLWSTLQAGGIAIVDELDTAIHPLILPEIVRWFYDPVRNPKNAQLWMSCHNASLLSEFSKEEILFCEKGIDGQTNMFGLRDINVHRRDNFHKKYLGGAYGAIPVIG
ncbi:ATP/GTP-binding protein [Methylorubrum thiocyanatum]|uniref:AAA family ATPase n=1 Tax=Methylorubrum thiocyanatum TaxID=47958 RepID=UPI00383BB5CD